MSRPDHSWILLNGKLRQSDEPVFGVEARSVRYGDGCFETWRSYEGAFLELQHHIERLSGAMEYLKIRAPATFARTDLVREVHELLKKNELIDHQAVVRLQVWREGSRGFAIPEGATSGYCISVSALPDIAESITLATVPTRRIPATSLDPHFKLSNSLNYIRSSTEARQQGADDALMQTVDGAVSETTIANIFWFSENTVYTPDETCDLLPGITRRIILKILETQLDLSCQQGSYSMQDIANAECIWVCNSVREIVPVRKVNNRTFDPSHPLLEELRNQFKEYRQNHLK